MTRDDSIFGHDVEVIRAPSLQATEGVCDAIHPDLILIDMDTAGAQVSAWIADANRRYPQALCRTFSTGRLAHSPDSTSLATMANDRRSGAGETILPDDQFPGNARYKTLVFNAPICIHEIDADGKLLSINPAGLKILGQPLEQVIGRPFLDFVAARDHARLQRLLAKAMDGEACEFEFEYSLTVGDADEMHFSSSFIPVRGADNVITHLMGLTQDISARKQSDKALRVSEERFRDYAQTAADYFWEMDSDLRFVNISGNYEAVTGLKAEFVLGKTREEVWQGRAVGAAPAIKAFDAVESHEAFTDVELSWSYPDGSTRSFVISGKPIFDDNGVFDGYRGSGRNISQMHQLSRELAFQASHDEMTGLINRREFENRLESLLDGAVEHSQAHVLLYMDLDQFKVINDTCGHVAGDELLKQVSGLIATKVRKNDSLARLGGDEFGLLMEMCSLKQAERVAHNILKSVRGFRFTWGEQPFTIGVSIGVVPLTRDSGSMSDIMSAADTACYAAKDQGRNRMQIYHADDLDLARRQSEMQWVSRITHALEQNRFELHAQPIFALDPNQVASGHFEILLRMQDEHGQLVSPGHFLPAAERYGLATRIDDWVINTVIEAMRDGLLETGVVELCAINLSGQSIGNADFLERLTSLIDDSGINPAILCFEITETAAIANLSLAVHFIETLKERGCSFSLDDFGSGLSSFAYLRNLPVDYLKIDGMFVQGVAHDSIDRAMVRSINDIGQEMGKMVIAEWVEDEQTLAVLRDVGVDFVQGYLIDEPRPLHEFISKTVARRSVAS